MLEFLGAQARSERFEKKVARIERGLGDISTWGMTVTGADSTIPSDIWELGPMTRAARQRVPEEIEENMALLDELDAAEGLAPL